MDIDRVIPISSLIILNGGRESEGKGSIDAANSVRIIMVQWFGMRYVLLFASWTAQRTFVWRFPFGYVLDDHKVESEKSSDKRSMMFS